VSTYKKRYVVLQKKMNARMQDALNEILLLSDKYEFASVPDIPDGHTGSFMI
jgi:hypothetical protein